VTSLNGADTLCHASAEHERQRQKTKDRGFDPSLYKLV
jgi:hypothetical protein